MSGAQNPHATSSSAVLAALYLRVAATLEHSADLAEVHAARHQAKGKQQPAAKELQSASRARLAAQRGRAIAERLQAKDADRGEKTSAGGIGGSEGTFTRLVQIRPLTRAEQATIAGWRYPARYATYNLDDPSALTRDHWAVISDNTLVGYCCFHDAARVAGVAESPGTLDVGYGLSPGRMGAGSGRRFVAAILDFAVETYEPIRLRMFILDWNQRSLTAATRHGFVPEGSIESDQGMFVLLGRAARTA